jgi:hypothetical protein
MLHKLMHADTLGFLEDICDVLPLLLSRVVGEHGEKMEFPAVVECLAQISPRSFPGNAL